MKTLIAYSTTLGCTEKCAGKLKEEIGPDVDMYRMSKRRKINFENYSTVIIGGSIHEGMIQHTVRKFCEQNLEQLLKLEIGLFICCVDPGENEDELLKTVFPEKLRKHSLANSYFGGELNFKKMNLMQKIMTRKKDRLEVMPEIDFDSILTFAEKLQRPASNLLPPPKEDADASTEKPAKEESEASSDKSAKKEVTTITKAPTTKATTTTSAAKAHPKKDTAATKKERTKKEPKTATKAPAKKEQKTATKVSAKVEPKAVKKETINSKAETETETEETIKEKPKTSRKRPPKK